MAVDDGWCGCSLFKQGRKGSRLQGGVLICNVCDLPILEGAAARAVFSGGQAAEQVPTNARVGAVTTEPTFDSTGLGGPNPTSPGWYRDPECADRFRRWDGRVWDGQRVSAADADRRLWAFYLLGCAAPLALAVALPLVAFANRVLGAGPAANTEGVALWLVGLVMTIVGSAAFASWRRAKMGDSRAWNRAAWLLVLGVAVFGFAGMSSNPTGVSSPDVPVGTEVTTGPFKVEVVSYYCDEYLGYCYVSERVHNTGSTAAVFPWESQRGVLADGDRMSAYHSTFAVGHPAGVAPGSVVAVDVVLGGALQDGPLALESLEILGADAPVDMRPRPSGRSGSDAVALVTVQSAAAALAVAAGLGALWLVRGRRRMRAADQVRVPGPGR